MVSIKSGLPQLGNENLLLPGSIQGIFRSWKILPTVHHGVTLVKIYTFKINKNTKDADSSTLNASFCTQDGVVKNHEYLSKGKG